VAAVKFSADGQLLATASADKTVKIWSVNDGRLDKTIQGFKNILLSCLSVSLENNKSM
jgi:WD40 repeat protein